MSNHKLNNLNLNRFFHNVHLKKQHFKVMHDKMYLLDKAKETNYKTIGFQFDHESQNYLNRTLVTYIIDVSFLKRNTLIHISDCSGNTKFFYSAGTLKQKIKEKKTRAVILKQFYKLLLSKFKFLQKVPLIVHFKNTDSNMFWFLKKLRKKFFVIATKHFYSYSYNGCRKTKIRRKKFKNRSFNIRRNG